MSEFHRTIVEALDEEKQPHEVKKVVEEHLKHLDSVFHIEEKISKELTEYYTLLKEAETYMSDVIEFHADKKNFDWRAQLEKLLRKAHSLILDIERKLEREKKQGKEFLE